MVEDDERKGPKTVTRLLRDWQNGDKAALDKLMPLIFAELHKRARSCIRGERAGHTFGPTELISEAYVRLVAGTPPAANDRVHFFAITARIMRQILVDSARHRCASKRGGGERPIPLDDAIAAADRPEDLVALDDSLTDLSKRDERMAHVIELYYYSGLTQDEVALVLGVHPNTIATELRLGLAWLETQLAAKRRLE